LGLKGLLEIGCSEKERGERKRERERERERGRLTTALLSPNGLVLKFVLMRKREGER